MDGEPTEQEAVAYINELLRARNHDREHEHIYDDGICEICLRSEDEEDEE